MKETVIIMASLLLVFLCWKELSRPAKAHLFLRLLASILAVAAMVCLALPIRYTVSSSTTNGGRVVILTPGFDKDSLAAYKTLPRYTTHPDLASGAIEFMPDIRYLLLQNPSIRELQVFGYGLETDVLTHLHEQGIRVQYHATALPAGFTAAGWPRQLHVGEWLEVQGSYHNAGKERVKIVLTGLGTRFDSVVIGSDSSKTFSLRCKPAQEGSILYELEVISHHKTLLKKKIPAHLLPASQPEVLVLSSSPNFDNKFLSTWLFENGYKVAVRNTISKNKYSQQFLNREAVGLQAITPGLLEKFDVVMADNEALAALNGSEKASLRSQIHQGLGLILQTDSTVTDGSFAAGMQVKKQAGATVSARPLIMPAVYTTTTPLLPAQWYSINQNKQAQPLVMDDLGTVVVSASMLGAGKLVLNTVNNTYSWILGGNRPDYAQFWSLLLNKTARRSNRATRWQQVTAFPIKSNPVQLTIETAVAGVPVINTPDGDLPPAQHAWLPNTWSSTWWPTTAGWQTVRHGQDSLRLYIFDNEDWNGIQATNSIIQNKRFSAVFGQDKTSKEAVGKEKKQVPPVIFFVLFLACCSYLWFEGKKQ